MGSLFSGIGGLELGLERTGYFRTIWQVEIDDYATKILEKHWPDVERFKDIRTTHPPYADLICGGFPCQDISNAGKKKGITGERSGLWKEFLRIIREVRPRYVLIENVAALANRGLDVVLCDLAQSGYDAEWNIVSAASVGAPHRRERIFIVAYAHSDSPSENGGEIRGTQEEIRRESPRRFPHRCGDVLAYSIPDAERRYDKECRIFDRTPKEALREASDRLGHENSSGGGWWAAEPSICRVVDGVPYGLDGYQGRVAKGVPNRVNKLKCLGNAVVPQCAQFVGECIKNFDIRRKKEC